MSDDNNTAGKLTHAQNSIQSNTTHTKAMIYIIRGQRIMMDSDLAMLYGVETKVFNQAVKRNESRFPDRFRFQLNESEYESMRSQSVTASKRNARYLPYAFTEQGIAMLSAILRSDTAIRMSIHIMDAFVEMNRLTSNNALILERINAIELKQTEFHRATNEKFKQIFGTIEQRAKPPQMIFYAGQIYDAFILLADIAHRAHCSITLIDNYIDLSTLNILSKKRGHVKVDIYTSKRGNRLTEKDISAFNAQYPQLKIYHTQTFHDRFLILDRKSAYHIGASIKDAGKKAFAISEIRDEALVIDLLGRVERKVPTSEGPFEPPSSNTN